MLIRFVPNSSTGLGLKPSVALRKGSRTVLKSVLKVGGVKLGSVVGLPDDHERAVVDLQDKLVARAVHGVSLGDVLAGGGRDTVRETQSAVRLLCCRWNFACLPFSVAQTAASASAVYTALLLLLLFAGLMEESLKRLHELRSSKKEPRKTLERKNISLHALIWILSCFITFQLKRLWNLIRALSLSRAARTNCSQLGGVFAQGDRDSFSRVPITMCFFSSNHLPQTYLYSIKVKSKPFPTPSQQSAAVSGVLNNALLSAEQQRRELKRATAS